MMMAVRPEPRSGAVMETIDESCGILVALNDIDALTGALKRLILAPELRASMGLAGEKRVLDLCDTRLQLPKLKGFVSALATSKRK